jgi:integrase
MPRKRLEPHLKERNGVWYVHDYDSFGRRLRVSTYASDLEKANIALAEYLAGKQAQGVPSEPLISDLLEAYAMKLIEDRQLREYSAVLKKAERTGALKDDALRLAADAQAQVTDAGHAVVVMKHLNRHLGHFRPSRMSDWLARSYRDARMQEKPNNFGKAIAPKANSRVAQTIQSSTILRELGTLRAAIKWGWLSGAERWFPGCEHPPHFRIPATSGTARNDYLTKEQAKALIDACYVPHLRLFVRIALETAARKRAIEDLQWKDIDLENGVIDFGEVDHKKLRPKIRISAGLKQELADVYKYSVCDHVLEWRGKLAGDVKKGLQRAATAAGLEWHGAHIFKHTVVTWLVSSGELSYSEIADIVNTSERTLRRHYAHLHPDNLDKLHRATDLGLKVRSNQESLEGIGHSI